MKHPKVYLLLPNGRRRKVAAVDYEHGVIRLPTGHLPLGTELVVEYGKGERWFIDAGDAPMA